MQHKKTSMYEVVVRHTHLNLTQKQELRAILEKYSKLFDGSLEVCPHKKVSIRIKNDAKPKHTTSYSILEIHLEEFKRELQHVERLGVLSS